MKKMVFVLTGFFVIAFSANQVLSTPYTITIVDKTMVGQGLTGHESSGATKDVDYVGADYDTAGINVSFAESIITIDLHTKYNGMGSVSAEGDRRIDLGLADLFFKTDSGWEYAIDMAAFFEDNAVVSSGTGGFYKVGTTSTSQDKMQNAESGRWYYGMEYANGSDISPIVDMNPYEDSRGDVSLGYKSEDDWNVFSVAFDISLLSDTLTLKDIGSKTFGIYWATAYCANDLVKGEFGVPTAPVPEPATMLLFGAGLVGLAGARFKNKNKK